MFYHLIETNKEIFIQDVLRNLKKHHVDVDKLDPPELDEMADIIADAIEAVDADEEKKNAAGNLEGEALEKGTKAEGKTDYETGLTEEGYQMQDARTQKDDVRDKNKENHLGAKLFSFLKKNVAMKNLSKEPLPNESLKTEIKKSEELDFSSSEEVKAGIENVKSETFSRELIAEKKAELEPNSEELTERHHWIKNTLIQDESTYEEMQNKMGGGLQLDTKSSKEQEYGYIVTEKEVKKPPIENELYLPMTAV
uniref:Uncharacterized protein n=1 Tax=Sphaerodactylus townsendi TaxID=933632 RepID=A0ACB8FW69_9SAUR